MKIFHAITKEFPVGQETEWFKKEMKRLDRMGLESQVSKVRRIKNGKKVILEVLEVAK